MNIYELAEKVARLERQVSGVPHPVTLQLRPDIHNKRIMGLLLTISGGSNPVPYTVEIPADLLASVLERRHVDDSSTVGMVWSPK